MGDFVRPMAMLIALLAALVTAVPAAADGPSFPRATGEQCVAPADVMRRDHMDLLNHQRDETVLDGLRSNPYSLVACVNCHTSRDESGVAIRIDAEGQFCQSCHAYAAVQIDCFSCHAAVPEQPQTVGARRLPSLGPLASVRETQILKAYAHGD